MAPYPVVVEAHEVRALSTAEKLGRNFYIYAYRSHPVASASNVKEGMQFIPIILSMTGYHNYCWRLYAPLAL